MSAIPQGEGPPVVRHFAKPTSILVASQFVIGIDRETTEEFVYLFADPVNSPYTLQAQLTGFVSELQAHSEDVLMKITFGIVPGSEWRSREMERPSVWP
jgi:hypothetical protein